MWVYHFKYLFYAFHFREKNKPVKLYPTFTAVKLRCFVEESFQEVTSTSPYSEVLFHLSEKMQKLSSSLYVTSTQHILVILILSITKLNIRI
jgi:hypothetical protein